jgi:hypothetical protein
VPSDSDFPRDGGLPPDGVARPRHVDTYDTVSLDPRISNGDMIPFPTSMYTISHPRASSVGAGPLQEKDGKTRQRVKSFLVAATERVGTAVHTDDTEFQRGRARDYVEVPGERYRNERFWRTAEQYNPPRDADGFATPVPPADQRSRAGSTDGDTPSGARQASPSSIRAGSLSVPPAAVVRRPHANTLPANSSSFTAEASAEISPAAVPSRGRHLEITPPPRPTRIAPLILRPAP